MSNSTKLFCSRRVLLGVGAALALLALAWPAAALTQRQIQQCDGEVADSSPEIAIQACSAVIQSGQFSGRQLAFAMHMRGYAHYLTHEYDRSIADLSEALRLQPDVPEALNTRGLAYAAKNDYDRALADYNEAIRVNPNYISSLTNRGILYNSMRDYDRAIANFDEVIRLDPKNGNAFFLRGLVRENLDDREDAIADLKQAADLHERDAAEELEKVTASPPANERP